MKESLNGTKQLNIHAYMSKVKIYNDSKELPFWNYKRIIQTGDFLYMIKGYDLGDEIQYDIKELKLKFDGIIEDYVLSNNTKSEDILNYGRYMSAYNELNKLTILLKIIDVKIKGDQVGAEIDNEEIRDVLSLFRMQKFDDLHQQKNIIAVKIQKIKNDINKLKNLIDKEGKLEKSSEQDADLDDQFINVCVGLEMHFDQKRISLYEYGAMVKVLINKVESLNKLKK